MALVGMDSRTGQPISGTAHLVQSVRDILTTPQGSRRMRPDYGSDLPRLVDLPVTPGWKSSVQAEVARALGRWEPRLKLKAVAVESIVDGRVSLRLSGEYLGEATILEVQT
ncbi:MULTISPECIES: GPW/gp25 family protein [unclassified Massilia]|nr:MULTISPECIES: GPW/gp25 family protein [unclassified Massilia]NVE01613.1 GPW/gp25 family protein [Massilia sp. BJB1822]UMR28554.1 GPW/gp25 family protein [Massilia sp. MB5]UTY60413.1 phage baseplate protein [Massilia sp. erpn]